MGKDLKKNRRKKKFRFTEYHLLLVSALIYIIQYSCYLINIINFPKWIYSTFFVLALLINFIVRKAKISVLYSGSEFLRVFQAFIVYFFLTFSIGLLLFGTINKQLSKNNSLEFYKLNIVRATEGSSKSYNRVYFIFNDEEQGVNLPGSPMVAKIIHNKAYLENCHLLLECRKGIFGTYIIEKKRLLFSENQSEE